MKMMISLLSGNMLYIPYDTMMIQLYSIQYNDNDDDDGDEDTIIFHTIK